MTIVPDINFLKPQDFLKMLLYSFTVLPYDSHTTLKDMISHENKIPDDLRINKKYRPKIIKFMKPKYLLFIINNLYWRDNFGMVGLT